MDAIDNQFGFKLYLDGLPSAVVVRDPVTGEVHNEYDDGIPVGKVIYDKDGNKKYVLYNHWILTMKTQPVAESKNHRIVGFEVEPRSYAKNSIIQNEYKEHELLYLDEIQKKPEGSR